MFTKQHADENNAVYEYAKSRLRDASYDVPPRRVRSQVMRAIRDKHPDGYKARE